MNEESLAEAGRRRPDLSAVADETIQMDAGPSKTVGARKSKIGREEIEGAIVSLLIRLLDATDDLQREILEHELESLLADFDLGPLSQRFLSDYRATQRDLYVLKGRYLEELNRAVDRLTQTYLAGPYAAGDDGFPRVDTKEVLVVDDDPDFLSLLPLQLEAMGHHCHVSDSGDAALVFLRNHFVDVLIVDVAMPNVSGPELVRRGEATGILPPKTFFMSALPFERIKSLAEQCGIGFLQKPSTNDKLLRALS